MFPSLEVVNETKIKDVKFQVYNIYNRTKLYFKSSNSNIQIIIFEKRGNVETTNHNSIIVVKFNGRL